MDCVCCLLALFVLADVASHSFGMHFHHSKYKVHHKMGKMKIKVKPEGAKLIFTGGDLDVDMHPAHAYVRPIHNVIVSHHESYHEEPEFHHDTDHEMHGHDHVMHEFEDDDDHSGHHELDHEHSHHHDEHSNHGHHYDDDGYGFGHFHHFPIPGHGHGQGGLLHDGFFSDHHHGHFRDEIRDVDSNQHDRSRHEDQVASRHEIADVKQFGSEADRDDDTAGRRDQTIAEQKLNDQRTDATLYGKNIFPDDTTTPTHKSKIETKMSEFAAKISPGNNKEKEDVDDGSTPGRSGTLSPFDDENDTGEDKQQREPHLPVRFVEPQQQQPGITDRFSEHQRHGPSFSDRSPEPQEDDPRIPDQFVASQKEAMRPSNRHSQEPAPKVDFKKFEKMANSIPPDIPDEKEFMEEKENDRNSKDIGAPRNVYVNMSGEPHNYGEENNDQGYPSRNEELEPDNESRGFNTGDYSPPEERKEINRDNFEQQDGDEGEEHERQSMNEFRARSQRIAKLANEAARKKDFSPPLVVHPGGDPRDRGLRKAFYEYNPTFKQSKHLVAITDFSVRSNIAKRKNRSLHQSTLRKALNARHGLMVDRLIASLKSTW